MVIKGQDTFNWLSNGSEKYAYEWVQNIQKPKILYSHARLQKNTKAKLLGKIIGNDHYKELTHYSILGKSNRLNMNNMKKTGLFQLHLVWKLKKSQGTVTKIGYSGQRTTWQFKF